MTIKIEAWQKKGIKQNKCIDKFEFCCWDKLFKWLQEFNLHQCPKCSKDLEGKYPQ